MAILIFAKDFLIAEVNAPVELWVCLVSGWLQQFNDICLLFSIPPNAGDKAHPVSGIKKIVRYVLERGNMEKDIILVIDMTIGDDKSEPFPHIEPLHPTSTHSSIGPMR